MDFNERYFGVPLAVILLLIGIGVATATSLAIVYETTIQGSVTVEETTSDNSYEVTVYRGDSTEEEVSSVDLGSLKPNQTIQKTLTLKNTGDAFISEVLAYEVIEINQDGWNTSSESRGSLGVGETLHLFVEVRAATDAQPGDYSGEIKIVCKGSE